MICEGSDVFSRPKIPLIFPDCINTSSTPYCKARDTKLAQIYIKHTHTYIKHSTNCKTAIHQILLKLLCIILAIKKKSKKCNILKSKIEFLTKALRVENIIFGMKNRITNWLFKVR